MINWPQSLVSDLARRQSVIFLGSGVSHNSKNAAGDHPKTWIGFLQNSLTNPDLDSADKKIIEKKIDERDLLMACELLRCSLGVDRFNALLRSEFQTPRFQEAEIHKAIFKIDSKIVATPNFDSIYETFAQHEAYGSIDVKSYYDTDLASCLRQTGRIVLKLHGSISSPNMMIFTQRDYAAARIKYSGFYELLNALLATQTFLFLGAGLNDPDIRLLLENYTNTFEWSRKHYFAIPKGNLTDREKEIYSRTLNLEFLTYSPVDNHKELTDSVKELVTSVETARDIIATDRSW